MSEQKIAGGFPPPGSSSSPGAAAIFGSFLRLGITALGGPPMVAHIKEMAVKRNQWLTEETFRDGVLKNAKHFSGATRGILASFVGLLFYMTIRVLLSWFIRSGTSASHIANGK